MELGAVYNVTCTRCGGHGHLKTECYASRDKNYELLEEEEPDIARNGGTAGHAVHASADVGKKQDAVREGAVRGVDVRASVGHGRGKAMTQPAWMTHGVGVGGEQHPKDKEDDEDDEDVDKDKKKKKKSKSKALDLPEKVTSREEALAIIARLKEEKKKRKEERRKRRKEKEERRKKKEKHKEKHSRHKTGRVSKAEKEASSPESDRD